MKKIIIGLVVMLAVFSYLIYNGLQKKQSPDQKAQTETQAQAKDKLVKMKMKDLVRHFEMFEKDKVPTIKESYNNGSLKTEAYIDGELSHFRNYYKNGNLRSEWYYLDREPHGTGKKYYDNGQLYSEAEFKSGLLEGRAVLYQREGDVVVKQIYENDVLIKEKWGQAVDRDLAKDWEKED